MSYVKIDGVPIMSSETSVELDSGEIIAVSLRRSAEGSRIVFRGVARQIDQDGFPVINPDGIPITSNIIHNEANLLRADDVARDCIRALLGEPTEIVGWGSQYLRDVSIRQAIAASTISNDDVNPYNLI